MLRKAQEASRRRIEAELRRPAYRSVVEQLRKEVRAVNGAGNADELWRELDAARTAGEQFEAAVRIAARGCHSPDASAWRLVCLRLFWRRLERVANRRAKWDPEFDELWQNVVFVFLESVSRLPPGYVAPSWTRKLLNRTTHRLHDLYRPRWRQLSMETPVPAGELIELAGVVSDGALDQIEANSARSRAARFVGALCRRRGLSETDALIVVATRLYGASLREVAESHGLHYEQVKKRRQRIEQKLRLDVTIVVPPRPCRGPLEE